MRKPSKPELYAKVEELTDRLRAAEKVALTNYRRWAILATTVEGWATKLTMNDPSERLSVETARGLRDAVDRAPRTPGDPLDAADRVLAFLAEGERMSGIDQDVVMTRNFAELTTADLRALVGAAHELEVRKDFHG